MANPSPQSSGHDEQLSYDQRAAAAIEAVRQMEAYLADRTAG